MIGADTGVVGPRGERAKKLAEEQSGEGKDGGDKRAGPAAAEVSELRDGLREEDLDGVALEIAQSGSAENGGDDDDAEEADAGIVIDVGPRAVEQNLAVGTADGPEAFAGDAEEVEGEPDQEINVSGDALEAEFELEREELPEHGHVARSPMPGSVLRLAGEVEEIDVFETRVDGAEAISWIGGGVHADLMQAANQMSRYHVAGGFQHAELVICRDDL